MKEIAPCPKCGGERIEASGYAAGLEQGRCDTLVCLSCRYVEFYMTSEDLERAKEFRSATLGKSAEEVQWERVNAAFAVGRVQAENKTPASRKSGSRRSLRIGIISVFVLMAIVIIGGLILRNLSGSGTPSFQVGQGVSDRGLYMQVTSIRLTEDKQGLIVHVFLRNDSETGVIVAAEALTIEGSASTIPNDDLSFQSVFPGSTVDLADIDDSSIPGVYVTSAEQLSDILDPGATKEGDLYFPSTNNGEQATSIRLHHGIGPENDQSSLEDFKDFDWKIPQKLEVVAPLQ